MQDDVEIVVAPDPGSITFGEDRTPILTFEEHHANLGPGWVLYYLDETDGVEDHFIGGELADIDRAAEQARRWLRSA